MPYKDKCLGRAKAKARYEAIKDSGICVQCKQPWTGKQKKCDACRQRDAENKAKRKAAWEAAGLCNRCGKHHAMEGVLYCEECYQKSKKHTDSEQTKQRRLEKYHSETKFKLAEQREQRKAAGLCTDCGDRPASDGSTLCPDCYNKRREVYERNRLTVEDRERSRQLDRDALEQQNGWSHHKRIRVDNFNDRRRLANKMGAIARTEMKMDMGEEITIQDQRKLDSDIEYVQIISERLKERGEKVLR